MKQIVSSPATSLSEGSQCGRHCSRCFLYRHSCNSPKFTRWAFNMGTDHSTEQGLQVDNNTLHKLSKQDAFSKPLGYSFVSQKPSPLWMDSLIRVSQSWHPEVGREVCLSKDKIHFVTLWQNPFLGEFREWETPISLACFHLAPHTQNTFKLTGAWLMSHVRNPSAYFFPVWFYDLQCVHLETPG